jgi:hypothetical protein
MAGGSSSRPDTLMQTEQQPVSKNPLADGAGHTFMKDGHGLFLLEYIDSCKHATLRVVVGSESGS